MSYPFRKILSPVDFDENSLAALRTAIRFARDSDGTILLFHVVPMIVAPTGVPAYVDLYKQREESATVKLRAIAARNLQGIRHEVRTHVGEPIGAILRTARREAVDLIVMAPHGRRGFSRMMLGSVAESVVRQAPCPVLCVPRPETDKKLVGRWMTPQPVAVATHEKLEAVLARMREGNFRCAPVVENGRLVGIISERDILTHAGWLDQVEVRAAMTPGPVAVSPETPLREAVRTLLERKIDSLPVVSDDRLEGVVTVSDVMRAFIERD